MAKRLAKKVDKKELEELFFKQLKAIDKKENKRTIKNAKQPTRKRSIKNTKQPTRKRLIKKVKQPTRKRSIKNTKQPTRKRSIKKVKQPTRKRPIKKAKQPSRKKAFRAKKISITSDIDLINNTLIIFDVNKFGHPLLFDSQTKRNIKHMVERNRPEEGKGFKPPKAIIVIIQFILDGEVHTLSVVSPVDMVIKVSNIIKFIEKVLENPSSMIKRRRRGKTPDDLMEAEIQVIEVKFMY